MNPFLLFISILFLGLNLKAQLITSQEAATHPEVLRVSGFEEHQQLKRQINAEQGRGLQIHLESLEIQAREYEKARREYQAQKRSEVPMEKQPIYREHVADREKQREEMLFYANEQRQIKADEKRLLNKIKLDGMRELGLPENRPRYDLDKRALYGAEAKFTRLKEPFPTGGGYTPPPANNFGSPSGPSNDTFPPPPAFEDFPPPPAFPEGDFDLPPPPPPMEDPGMPAPADDFFPPPPPPVFDDNFNF